MSARWRVVTRRPQLFYCPLSELDWPAERQVFWEGAHVNSTLKIRTLTLIEKIKAEIKKRAELKAKRKLLKLPKRLAKR